MEQHGLGMETGKNELRACSDLLEKGFEVFKSICQCGSCVLVAMKYGSIFRVEVTNTFRNHINPDNYDILAVVTFDTVLYMDNIGQEIDITEKTVEKWERELRDKDMFKRFDIKEEKSDNKHRNHIKGLR